MTETRESRPWRMNGFLFAVLHLAFGWALVRPWIALQTEYSVADAFLVGAGGLLFAVLWSGYLILQDRKSVV